MVDKHIPQDRQVRVLRRELTCIGAERGAETLQGSRVCEFADFEFGLLGEQFTFEICECQDGAVNAWPRCAYNALVCQSRRSQAEASSSATWMKTWFLSEWSVGAAGPVRASVL